MTVPLNTIFYKAKDSDLHDFRKDDIHLDINCHAIGTIQSFNPTLQTATAYINYQKVIYQDTGGGDQFYFLIRFSWTALSVMTLVPWVALRFPISKEMK